MDSLAIIRTRCSAQTSRLETATVDIYAQFISFTSSSSNKFSNIASLYNSRQQLRLQAALKIMHCLPIRDECNF